MRVNFAPPLSGCRVLLASLFLSPCLSLYFTVYLSLSRCQSYPFPFSHVPQATKPSNVSIVKSFGISVFTGPRRRIETLHLHRSNKYIHVYACRDRVKQSDRRNVRVMYGKRCCRILEGVFLVIFRCLVAFPGFIGRGNLVT